MISHFDNWLYWIIISTGFVSYISLFDLLFEQRKENWLITRNQRTPLIKTALTSLPLLGLLGTIIGLLQTFQEISHGQSDTLAMLSGGLGVALGSTQLGLILAVPGLVLMHILLASNHLHNSDSTTKDHFDLNIGDSKVTHRAI